MSDNHQGGGKFKPIIIYKTAELLQQGLLNDQCTGCMFDDYGIDCPQDSSDERLLCSELESAYFEYNRSNVIVKFEPME